VPLLGALGRLEEGTGCCVAYGHLGERCALSGEQLPVRRFKVGTHGGTMWPAATWENAAGSLLLYHLR